MSGNIQKRQIIMIGFDYDRTGKHNNIYKCSNNYDETKSKTFPSKEFLETFKLYPQMNFVQYGNWADELNEYENVRLQIFCIGNGESRKDFDLHTLREHGKYMVVMSI